MVSDDRGQLILVGAVTIALIILGLVLVINTALFTQVVGSEGTTENVKEGGLSVGQIGDGIGTVVAEENRVGYPTRSAIETEVQNEIDAAVEGALRNRTVEGSGAFIEIRSFSRDEPGTRVYQSSSGPFESGGPWTMFSTSPPVFHDIGGLFVTVDEPAGGTLDLELSNATTSESLTISTGGGTVDLSRGGPGCQGIPATDGTVRIDVSNGRAYENSTCTFSLFEEIDGPYNLEFSGSAEGTYTVATDAPSVAVASSTDPIIWSFEYEYLYDGPEVTVESDGHEVDVYD